MSVPATRTLPAVLRQRLAVSPMRLTIAKVVSIPSTTEVAVDTGGLVTVVPRLTSFVPTLGKAVYLLVGTSLVLAIGDAGGALPGGAQGPPGPQGPAGPAGPQGAQGAPGAPGSVWWFGVGVPPTGVGVVGDFYLDTNNGAVYTKTGSSIWSLVGNLRGPAGPQGPQGPQGPAGPAGSLPPLVSALPGSPTDGQEAYLLADDAGGVVWHLRYRAASSSPYKWEYLGGPPIYRAESASTSGIGTTLVNDPNGPVLPIPRAGDYTVAMFMRTDSVPFGQQNIWQLPGVAGLNNRNNPDWTESGHVFRVNGLAVTTVGSQVQCTQAGGRQMGRVVHLTPIRVS